MGSRSGNDSVQDSLQGRHSPPDSSPSLNPNAVVFTSNQPEVPFSPPQGPASTRRRVAGQGQQDHGQPNRSNSTSRATRARGRVQTQPAVIPLPNIPPRQARHGHGHPQPAQQYSPAMPGLNPPWPMPPYHGQAFPGLFPGVPFQPYMGGSGMPYQAGPPGYQPQQIYYPAPPSGTSATPSYAQTPPSTTRHRSSGPKHSLPSTPAQPKRTVSGSTQEKAEQTPEPESREDPIAKCRREFEVARSFEDDHIYFPNSFPDDKK
ncbi:hypothetical protein F4825DRAFT_453065 [Nemania diffusa]|nr:hypothetical protein F4825DRAFT_453065 [Nemania diffusa]